MTRLLLGPSIPITNKAGILQVAPGSPAAGLIRNYPGGEDRRNFARVVVAQHQEGRQIDAKQAGHDAMVAILEAIEAADDPLDRVSVTEALFASENPQTDPESGPTLRFDSLGNRIWP